MANTILNLYTVEKPDWSYITTAQKERIAEFIKLGGWYRDGNLRRGFLNCNSNLQNDIIYGYFAQEGRIHVEQYDDEQRPLSGEQESFERILFLFFLTPGILAVQSVRVPRYIDLTGSELRENFFGLLEVAFRNSNIVYQGNAIFERYKDELSREELIRIFEERQISRVIVKDLSHANVPADLKLFNPDFDADAFLKAVIDGDLEKTTEAEWAGDGIQEAKIVRGLVHAGNPTLIEGVDDTGHIREWTPVTPQSITLELDTNDVYLPEEDFGRVRDLIERTFGSFDRRLRQLIERSDQDDLPLFEGRQD